ncbi:hypothetical protein FRC04_002800 [Tulasnella sp. 424]|nr:hypothetical protein FRC04_002800 [Tulasnella sp. 424]KAG8966612.1 hypothetical protein FRC05_002490 [Tulasnella sp. 425]
MGRKQLFSALFLALVAILFSPLLQRMALRSGISSVTKNNITPAAMSPTAPTAPSPLYPNVKLVPRPNTERGGADHGWLKTFHTFSFADYRDPRYNSFGNLRVINEDRVEPSEGFGTHGHREMEIFSYIVSGELEHKDSMGNLEILKRGDVQLTSAGTGVRHSEYNRNDKSAVHFLQIWAEPHTRNLEPKYFTRHFTDEEKTDKLVTVVAPVGSEGVKEDREGSGPAPVQSTVTLKSTILTPGKSVEHVFPAPASWETQRKAYVHVIQTSGYNTNAAKGNRVRVNGVLELSEGDGSFAWGAAGDKLQIENIGTTPAEVLVFDIM